MEKKKKKVNSFFVLFNNNNVVAFCRGKVKGRRKLSFLSIKKNRKRGHIPELQWAKKSIVQVWKQSPFTGEAWGELDVWQKKKKAWRVVFKNILHAIFHENEGLILGSLQSILMRKDALMWFTGTAEKVRLSKSQHCSSWNW